MVERKFELPYALIRGRYLKNLIRPEILGVPVDVPAHNMLMRYDTKVQRGLIRKLDAKTGLFDVVTKRFCIDRFEAWLDRRNAIWPRTKTGQAATDKETMAEMAGVFPELENVRQLKRIVTTLGCSRLRIGQDGRARAGFSPFGTVTGRNQPSSTDFIFGLPKYLRHLIKPKPGFSIAQLDYEQQEVGIAARLSGDKNLEHDYLNKIYVAFMIRAGFAPAGADKDSHPEAYELSKTCVLSMQYGVGAEKLAYRLQKSVAHAQHYIKLHRQAYPVLYNWMDGTLNYALLHGSLETAFGWRIQVTPFTKSLTLKNWPIQSCGGEMLRLAIIMAVESGVQVCCPVHDCLVIEAPTQHIEEAIRLTHKAMTDASKILLDGFELKIETKQYHAPDRYRLPKNAEIWNTIWDTIDEIDPFMRTITEQCR